MKALLLLTAAICAAEAGTLRCPNFLSDYCSNSGLTENNNNQDGSTGKRDVEEGLVGSADDEQWLTGGETPGKRSTCKVQIMGDCLDYLIESNSDQEGSVGKRSSCKVQIMGDCFDNMLESNNDQGGSVGRRRVGGQRQGKRCANLFDDSCSNGGLVGSVDDESWLSGGSTPGKRALIKFGGSK